MSTSSRASSASLVLELIRSMHGAPNTLFDPEELDEKQLDAFRKRYEDLAQAARVDLERVIGAMGTPEP